MPLPGDDLVPSPLVETTHAVTINGVFSELAHLRGCVGCWTSAYRLRGPPPIPAPHAFSPTLGRLTRRGSLRSAA